MKVFVITEEFHGEKEHPQESMWLWSFKSLNAAKYAVEKVIWEESQDLGMAYPDFYDDTPGFINWSKNKYSNIWFGESYDISYTIIQTDLK